MKKFILLVITAALFSKLSKAELSNLGDNNILNTELMANESVHLSLGEIFKKTGSHSYLPLEGQYKLGVHYFSGMAAMGASLSGSSINDDLIKNPQQLDVDLDVGVAFLNNSGQIVALMASVGARGDSLNQSEGNFFYNGVSTDTTTEHGFKAGGKIQVLLTIVNGEISVMALPYASQWEINATIEANLTKILNRFEIDSALADLARLDFSHRASVSSNDGVAFGFTRLTFEKLIVPLGPIGGGSGIYFDYGADISWNNKKQNPNVTIFIGGRLKL